MTRSGARRARSIGTTPRQPRQPEASKFHRSTCGSSLNDKRALTRLQQVLDPYLPLAVHLNRTLESLDQTSRSFGELTDHPQRNPAALVRGRYVSDVGAQA